MTFVAGKTRRWHRTAAVALMSVSLLGAACGGGDRGGEEGGGSDTGARESNVDESNLTPQRGGELIYALEASSTGGYCLPEAQLAVSGIMVASAIFDPLFAFNERREPTPYLAESHELSEDGRTHTLTIREGITFSNGEALDAGVVKLNIDTWRGAAPETGRTPLLFLFVFDNIESVEAPDDRTVVITTKVAWPALTNYLASGRYGIAAPEQINSTKADCAAKPIGSGPFKAEGTLNLSEGADIKLVRNDNHWRTDADGNRLPYLDGITFRPIPDPGKRAESLAAQTGGVDIIHINDGAAMQSIEAAAQDGRLKYTREGVDYAEVGYLMFNQSGPPFDDVRARRLVAHAVDREILNELVNNGEFPLANSPFGPGVIGHLDTPENFPKYDPEEAARLSEEIGGLEFTFTYIPTVQKLADEVKRQLEQIPGVKVQTKTLLQSALIDTAIRGDFQALSWRNHPGADPDTQYNWWKGGSPVNFGKFQDPEVDRLLDAGRSELDEGKRAEIYEQLSERFAEQVHNGWTWYSLWGVGSRTKVFGALGRQLPNGDKPLGLWVGITPLAELWVEQ